MMKSGPSGNAGVIDSVMPAHGVGAPRVSVGGAEPGAERR